MIRRLAASHTAHRALALVAGLVLVAGGYLGGDALRESSLKTLRDATYGQCHRQNLGRITANRNNYSGYKLFQATISLLEFSASQPPSQPANPKGTALFDAFVAAMRQSLAAESWTPLSDCREAIDHPLSYVPPAAVPFGRRLPPPSAFTIGPRE